MTDYLSYKVKLNLSPSQEQLVWNYAYARTMYWNLILEVARLNLEGHFDELLESNGCKVYWSEKYQRSIYHLDGKTLRYLAKHRVFEKEAEGYDCSWYFRDNQSFIYTTVIKDFMKSVKQFGLGKLKFRRFKLIAPSFRVRCDVSGNRKRPSRIYRNPKNPKKLIIPTVGSVKVRNVPKGIDLDAKKQVATVSFDGKHWYLSVTTEVEHNVQSLKDSTDPIGIDLGIKTVMTVSNGMSLPSFMSNPRYRRKEKQLAIHQRRLSRKHRINGNYDETRNIRKLKKQIKLGYRRLTNLRKDMIYKFVKELVDLNPEYISIENLNVKGMLRNKHLSRSISRSMFYFTREHITNKARQRGIEVRIVNRFYASSKLCSGCGNKKVDLTLSQRVYNCDVCGLSIDRDLNASYNLRDTDDFVLV